MHPYWGVKNNSSASLSQDVAVRDVATVPFLAPHMHCGQQHQLQCTGENYSMLHCASYKITCINLFLISTPVTDICTWSPKFINDEHINVWYHLPIMPDLEVEDKTKIQEVVFCMYYDIHIIHNLLYTYIHNCMYTITHILNSVMDSSTNPTPL